MSDLRSLCRWGVIGVEGADAVAFLQAQLSNDIAGMGDGQLRLAGLCTAKGRLLGSFFVARQGEAVMLICRADTIAALVKRLSMFVLRSKCKVMDWTDRCVLSYLTDCGQTHPMTVQWSAPLTGVISLRAFDDALPGLQIQPKSDAVCDSSCDNAFELALFNLGIAYIGSAAVELFVPQAINFDLVGGVSFSKGCYPGQEVVARSHYLGKLKRRAFKAMASGAGLKVGADVWLAGKDNEPVGQVVTVVKNDQAICAMLELPIEDVETPGARFFVKTEEGELVLQLIQPPYDVHQKGSQFASA